MNTYTYKIFQNKAAEAAKTGGCQEIIDKIKNKDKEMRAKKIAIEKEIQGIATQIEEINAVILCFNKSIYRFFKSQDDQAY